MRILCKWPLAAALLAAVCQATCLQAGEDSRSQARPNILFFLADDWSWPHAGAYGDKVVRTPAFDRLAREGVLFEHAFVSSPSCTPCRNSILTGQQFYRLDEGASLWSTLDPHKPNFMFLLRAAGYEIGHWRKAWGPGDYTAGGYTEHPCGPEIPFNEFMESRDRGKPFCFWFGTNDPHRPYLRGSGISAGIEAARIHLPGYYPDSDEIRSDFADYYFEVQRWDSEVADALSLLEGQGLLDDTILVMSGDNGMPFPRCKTNLYDGGVRVPLAIRWGNAAPPSRRVSDFVSLTDLAPTFLEAAGIVPPEEMTGRSLLPILTAETEGRVEASRDHIIFGRERHVPAQENPSMLGYPARAIRSDNWLLILNLKPDRWPAGVPENASHRIGTFADCDESPTKDVLLDIRPESGDRRFFEWSFARRDPVELYDCVGDPDQLTNLADDPAHAAIRNRLRSQLIHYLEATADPRFVGTPVLFESYPYRNRNNLNAAAPPLN